MSSGSSAPRICRVDGLAFACVGDTLEIQVDVGGGWLLALVLRAAARSELVQLRAAIWAAAFRLVKLVKRSRAPSCGARRPRARSARATERGARQAGA